MKNPKLCAKEGKNSFKSHAKEKKSQKNSKPHADRGAKHQFVKNLKPSAKEEKNITSNLVRKRREVIGSSRTLNLVRKRKEILL